MRKILRKSTDFIIADFMDETFSINFEEHLKEEIKFVRKHNFGLKDVSSKFSNIKISNERQLHTLAKHRSKRDKENWHL
jgi:hypothetical protein